ncbi:hypothetical protein C0992_002760 [Termitomyces sp. T32_za158]|nr:hypothetical protein C0992_002760 [Termitomyces sp. T32_za158]
MKTRGRIPGTAVGRTEPPLVEGTSLQSLTNTSTDLDRDTNTLEELTQAGATENRPAAGRAQVSTTPVVPLEATRPAEGGPRPNHSAHLTDPFIARTPPAPSARWAAPSPAGPTPKRPRRQARSGLDTIGEAPLMPSDIDQYLQAATRVPLRPTWDRHPHVCGWLILSSDRKGLICARRVNP